MTKANTQDRKAPGCLIVLPDWFALASGCFVTLQEAQWNERSVHSIPYSAPPWDGLPWMAAFWKCPSASGFTHKWDLFIHQCGSWGFPGGSVVKNPSTLHGWELHEGSSCGEFKKDEANTEGEWRRATQTERVWLRWRSAPSGFRGSSSHYSISL